MLVAARGRRAVAGRWAAESAVSWEGHQARRARSLAAVAWPCCHGRGAAGDAHARRLAGASCPAGAECWRCPMGFGARWWQ